MKSNRLFFLIIILTTLMIPVFAQDAESGGSGADFGLGLLLGVETFDTLGGTPETYQTIALQPDLAIGNFGVGLDVVLHYRFVDPADNDGSSFDIREEDWVIENGTFADYLALYMPKITYVRYGYKGDPLYVKYGQIEDATLGTGFIVSNYSNTLFQPNEKIAGLNFDMDGTLFKFPYVGLETFVGNLASFDVIGGRIYARPMIWSEIPVLKNLEWGISGAWDTAPDYREEYFDSTLTADTVFIWGTDIIQPVLNLPFLSLALFGDVAFQGANHGEMIGFGGRIISILPYVFQVRFLGENFIPSYFDSTYDIYRGTKFAILNSDTTVIDPSVAWMATTGISLFDDMLMFTATVDGPFEAVPELGAGETVHDYYYTDYPHMLARLILGEGLIPKFSLEASYDKKYITSFSDLIAGEDSYINLAVNYDAGGAVVTLSYDLLYNPDDDPELTMDDYTVNSTLSCSLQLF